MQIGHSSLQSPIITRRTGWAVVDFVNSANSWALLADETTDRHHREQLAIVVRYVHADESGKWSCFEDPIAIIDAYSFIDSDEDKENEETRLSGVAIGKALVKIVSQLGLNLKKCVGQGYDGASALSSQRVGAAAEVQLSAPSAHYFHCAMHCLNLSASKPSQMLQYDMLATSSRM